MADTVFIVDDDQAVRHALHFTLKNAGFEVQLYASAQEFIDTYRSTAPGCMVLDVRMPGMSGLDLQAVLERYSVTLPVIILTGHGDVTMAVRALKQGAFDFLEKPFDNDRLIARIREAIAQHKLNRHRDQRLSALRERVERLKPRERRVLDGIVAGYSNKMMAARLHVSISTIESHRRDLMVKLEAENLSDLVRIGLALQGIDED